MSLDQAQMQLLDTGARMAKLGLMDRSAVDAVAFFKLPLAATADRWADLVGKFPNLNTPANTPPEVMLVAFPGGQQEPIQFVPRVNLQASENVVEYLETIIRMSVPDDVGMPPKGDLPRKFLMQVLDRLENDKDFEKLMERVCREVFKPAEAAN